MTTAFWTLALAAGLLWPARSFSVFDGIPLDGRVEAIVIGVVFPALWRVRDRDNHVVVAGPFVHREAPAEHENSCSDPRARAAGFTSGASCRLPPPCRP